MFELCDKPLLTGCCKAGFAFRLPCRFYFIFLSTTLNRLRVRRNWLAMVVDTFLFASNTFSESLSNSSTWAMVNEDGSSKAEENSLQASLSVVCGSSVAFELFVKGFLPLASHWEEVLVDDSDGLLIELPEFGFWHPLKGDASWCLVPFSCCWVVVLVGESCEKRDAFSEVVSVLAESVSPFLVNALPCCVDEGEVFSVKSDAACF